MPEEFGNHTREVCWGFGGFQGVWVTVRMSENVLCHDVIMRSVIRVWLGLGKGNPAGSAMSLKV